MAIFRPKPWVNPFRKMSIFPIFDLLVFIAQKGIFLFQNIVKDIFLVSIAKKRSWKNAIFGPKPWVTPFRKMSLFRLFELLVFIAQKGIFRSRISYKTFSCSILPKKKSKKIGLFAPKPWVNHFRKMSIFRLFDLLVFIAQKGIFRSRISYKTFSWSLLPKKRNLEKWPFLDQNSGLTPLQKCQFFDFLIFLFLQPRKAFFVLEYRTRHFSGLYCLRRKKLE